MNQDRLDIAPGVITPEPKPASKRSPIFGILSILAPFIGGLCLLCVRDHAGTMDYMENANKRWVVLMGTPIVGIVSVVAAWIRHERYLALRFIGLLFVVAMAAVLFVLIALVSGLGSNC